MSLAFWRSPGYVLVGCTFLVMISFGVRQSFGLFMVPLSIDMGWGREVFSFTIAIQNLIIGLAAPFVAATADKWGPIRIIALAGLVYTAGVYVMSLAGTPMAMVLSGGGLVGLGVSGCGLTLLLALTGRVAPENKRTMWLGIVTGGGTAGQLIVVPASQRLIGEFGWVEATVLLAIMTAAIPFIAMSLKPGSAEALSRKTQQSLTQALKEASRHRGYWLLITGFSVCGFQVQFIAAHLPAYLTDSGAPPSLGATAIATIGLFNFFGAWGAGWLGDRYRKKYLLSLLYTLRALAILVFIQFPVSQTSVLLFCAVLGILWLSTAPLTSGMVAEMFGVRYMGTLFGITYMSHQFGSFLGVWLGGVIYDSTGTYTYFWWLAIVMGLVAALIHWPIDDRPTARLAEQK